MRQKKFRDKRTAILLPFFVLSAFLLLWQKSEAQQNNASHTQVSAGQGMAIPGKYSQTVSARISRVVNGLLPPFVMVGEPVSLMKLTDRMNHHGTPGVSVAVINNYRVDWIKHYGFADKEQQRPINDQTIYQAGSISKPMTAFLVMKLVQQGKLEPDRNVNNYLRAWKVPDSKLTKDSFVTIRKILNHTAGFLPYDLPGSHPDSVAPTLVQVLNGEPPAHNPPVQVAYVPGTKTEYTGAGYIILQQLLVDLFHKPFSEIMQKEIFQPLGMQFSTFENPIRNRALYNEAAAGYQRGVKVDAKDYTKAMQASGGLWSNVHDLAIWVIEIQKSLLGKGKILNKKMAALMLQRTGVGDSLKGFTLGFNVNRQGSFLRFNFGGYTDGFRSEMVCFANGQGFVVLTNGNSQVLLRELTKAVATEYGWLDPQYIPIQRKLIQVPADVLQLYVDEYEFPEGRNPRVSKIELRDGKLYFEGIELLAEGNNRFFGAGESTIIFQTNEAGKATGLTQDFPEFQLPARKIK